MYLIAILLLIMIVLTLINGMVFFKKLIKLQQENNELIKKLLNKNKEKNENTAMPSAELEKLKSEFMKSKK
tara:strand:- start:2474 stop:2686 length:213 start_codon:yes stop_codon:yes gene_type:complete